MLVSAIRCRSHVDDSIRRCWRGVDSLSAPACCSLRLKGPEHMTILGAQCSAAPVLRAKVNGAIDYRRRVEKQIAGHLDAFPDQRSALSVIGIDVAGEWRNIRLVVN